MEVFFIVEGQDDLLVFLERGDALGQGVLELLLLQNGLRLDGGVLGGYLEPVSLQVPGIHQRVQRQGVAERHPGGLLLILVGGDAQMARHLLVGGEAPQLVGQMGHSGVDLLGPLPDVPGQPVLLPGQVDDHAPDALGHVGLKLDALVRVELVDGAEQGEDALADDVVHLGEAAVHPPDLEGGALDEPLIPQHQRPFQVLIPGLLVKAEQVGGGHGLDLRLGVPPLQGGSAHVPTALLSARMGASAVILPSA